jgi:outer membrane lipoprotein-sorting protein
LRFLFPVLALLLLPARVALAAPPSAAEIVDQLDAHYKTVNDYQVLMDTEQKGKGAKKAAYRMWVLKPDLFRLKVEKGDDKGSELAVTPTGKVRARPGGPLARSLTKTYEKTDEKLRGPRGGYAWDSEFGSQYRKLRQNLARADKPEVAEVAGMPDLVQLKLTYQDADRKAPTTETWTIDTKQWVVTQMDVTEDGKLVEHTAYKEYKENAGLMPKFFEL